MSRSSLNQIGLLAVYAALVAYALQPGWSQDFLPWYSAGQLVLTEQVDEIYLPATSTDLFSSRPAFIQASLAAAGRSANAHEVTAFVAPPPSLLLTFPLLWLSYPAAATLWRLLLAGVAIASLHTLAARRNEIADHGESRWIVGVLLFLPILGHAITAGQPSVLLLGAAALGVGNTRWAAVCFPAALAAAIMFKVFPVLLIGFLFLMGRRRVAGWTLGICTVWTILSFATLPGALWIGFFEGLRALTQGVITDSNNLSIDALLLRWASGETTVRFTSPQAWTAILAGATKAAVLALAVATAAGWRQANEDRRWSASWIGTLSLTPLLWIHYLVVLPAVLPMRSSRDQLYSMVLLVAAGAWMVLRSVDAIPALLLGTLGSLLWLLVVAAVLVREPAGDQHSPAD